MIGQLPDTIADRSVIISMRRKARGERADRLRLDKLDLKDLRSKAARWVTDNKDVLRGADPDVPDSLDDRAQDNWRRLLAIADCAGADWGKRARKAAVILSGGKNDDGAVGTLLLADLKRLFDGQRIDRLVSVKIIEELVTMEERPWSEWRGGKPLSTRGLANLLKPFDVRPRPLRITGTVVKGYSRADLEDAWTRYLSPDAPKREISATPSDLSVTRLQTAPGLGLSQIDIGHKTTDVTDEKAAKIASELDCNRVTDGNSSSAVNEDPEGGRTTELDAGATDEWTEA
jgi:putative DNA primase/helicase